MKTLLLFLLIPLNAMSADMCTELRNYYKSFETQLAGKVIKDCKDFKLEENDANKVLLKVSTLLDVYKDTDADADKTLNLFEKVKCRDISFLENRMRDVESQLNSIMGFNKLVKTISDAKEEIIIDKVAEQKEMKDFMADVGTAALLETYVQNPAFFKFLTADDLKDAKSYNDGVKKHCVGGEIKKFRLTELCASLTTKTISNGSLTSLRDLLETYQKGKDDKAKTDLLNSWKSELIITKADGDSDYTNNKEYSFIELNNDIQNKPMVTMSERLRAIKSIPQIAHIKNDNSGAIDKLFQKITTHQVKAQKNLEAKRLITVHNDLHDRQLAERNSRLSLLWLEFKPAGSVEISYAKQLKILKTVRNDLSIAKDDKATHLGEAIRALEATEKQVTKLASIANCLDVDKIDKVEIQKVCEKIIKSDTVTEQTAELNNELKLLTTIHNTILDEDLNPSNLKLVKLKQLALDALKKNKCTQPPPESTPLSSLSDCNIVGVINPELEEILIKGLDVTLVLAQPDEDDLEDAKEICEGSDKSEYNAFCALVAKSGNSSKKPDHSKEKVNGPLSPESRNNPVREAFLNGARNLASQIGQMFQQNKMPYYMNNRAPNYGPPSPTISQYLIGTSVASGQMRPYTSVTQNFFAYKSLR